MLVLLPPSETEAPGGDGAPLDLAALTWPGLTGVRARLVAALVAFAGDPRAARTVLGTSEAQDGEVARNAARLALERYSGVLHAALDVRSLTCTQRARADRRLAVGSALFGVVRGTDGIPLGRLGAARPAPAARPRPAPGHRPELPRGGEERVLLLRSGAYAALAPVPGAVTLDVRSERPDGTRTVVSHANEAHEGRVARLLATTTGEPGGRRPAAGAAATGRVARGARRRHRTDPRGARRMT